MNSAGIAQPTCQTKTFIRIQGNVLDSKNQKKRPGMMSDRQSADKINLAGC